MLVRMFMAGSQGCGGGVCSLHGGLFRQRAGPGRCRARAATVREAAGFIEEPTRSRSLLSSVRGFDRRVVTTAVLIGLNDAMYYIPGPVWTLLCAGASRPPTLRGAAHPPGHPPAHTPNSIITPRPPS